MSTVYLHIGTAKTGTTAIQRFLPLNQERLGNEGYVYPEMPFHFPRIGRGRNAHFLTMFLEDDPELKKRWEEGFACVEEALKTHDKAILSDENLWRIHAEEGFLEAVKEEFDKIGAQVKIVVYFRRQDKMAESHWNQMVKGKPKLSQSFEEFITSGVYSDFPLDYDNGASRLSRIFGKENIIIRVFEKNQFYAGSLFKDFLMAVGLDPEGEWQYPEHAVNTRLPENVVEIKRIINTVDAYRDENVPNFFREVIRQAYSLESQNGVPDQKTGRFSDEERKEYMRRFDKGNTYIAREYLNRASAYLFNEPLTEMPKYEPEQWGIMQDMIRVLAGADVYQYKNAREIAKENKELKKRVSELESNLVDASRRMADMQRQLNELYNSAIFRFYRVLRGKKKPE